MEDRRLSEKESLELISQMIRNTKNKVGLNDGSSLLLWGYLTLFVSLLEYGLWAKFENPLVMLGWMLIPLIGYPVSYYMKRKNASKSIVTYTDRMLRNVWLVVGAFAVMIPIYMSLKGFTTNILFVELLLILIGGILTAGLVKENSLRLGCCAAIGILFSMPGTLTPLSMVAFGIAFVFMMIIPGHIINYKARKQCLKN